VNRNWRFVIFCGHVSAPWLAVLIADAWVVDQMIEADTDPQALTSDKWNEVGDGNIP